ncbi:hypothetical protein NHX12_024386 [Muraenolepis orangiensis]|uniref:Bulb-type lectin domain-containing protein n=1 Tax=Muraenolepis orangiensis TaxID=630683 RepID=A0A9Q0EHA2_9TELE|nr:hypothetical protein NHX12_024386 [Muraenolepis orangiensis]KAJ3607335.1 hypothetical protein NHX12_024386 [Muraenolepis orangiensis]
MNSLSTNQELRRGDILMSENKQYKACFEDNGNLVIYKWSQIWDTKTGNIEASRVLLQDDTNLVIYTDTGLAVWHSNTFSPEAKQVRMTLTNGGQLVIDNHGETIWRSGPTPCPNVE